MRRSENAFATGHGGNAIAKVLRADDSRSRLLLHGADVDLNHSLRFIPLHPPDGGAAVWAGGDHFGAQAGGEGASGALIGESKTDGRHIQRASAFVGNQDGKATRGARTGSIGDAFAFDDPELYDHRGVGGNCECQNAAQKAACGG